MPINKEKKVQILDDLNQKFEKTKINILINYAGLTTEQISALRDELEKKNNDIRVIKNNLIKLAAKKNNISLDPQILKGQIAIIFGFDDEVEPSKILAKFIKKEKKPEIIGAIYEKEFIDEDTVSKLGKIPERNVLEAQLVGAINAPISGLVYTLKANLSGLISVLKQYQQGLK